MAAQDEQKYDERLLVRYLLGALSREETERLDELSIVDDDFAAQLNAAENDLVDAYVRKELSGGDLERFTTSYLSSPRRRRKVEFAETLRTFPSTARKPAPETQAIAIEEVAPAPTPASFQASSPKRSSWGWGPRLAFAGFALALLVVAGYLWRENNGLRRELKDAQAGQGSVLQHQQQLEAENAQQRSANDDLRKQLEEARQAKPNVDQLKTVAMVLPPPTRGAARIPVLTLGSGADLAILTLGLDTDDFRAYHAALKDPATNAVVWHSATLQSSPMGERKAVSLSFPASLLKSQNYVLELTGQSAKGRAELVASYPFRAVIK
ncbi:MAG TPA: hypothetical protein VKW06_20010 [Candidatus Angelobacter sp.]|nr:hypothetical protein [Candidatus Angelobacter sp.]